jgi:2-iminobutanoate/2-iminopropanoate deaminase
MEVVSTRGAPQPAGHYSQAIIHEGCVYVSGQLPINPENGEKVLGPVEDQARQVLKNLSEILKASGSHISQTLKVTVYISDIELWDKVNAVYAEFFGNHRPARSVVPTKELHFGFKIEIDAIGAITG